MKQKIYTSAPLPFQGQKRRHVKEFSKIIQQTKPKLIVDLFGGSGLLSHVSKRICPDSRVIYNDYDGYHIRLSNIDKTNALLAELRLILSDYPKDKKIEESLHKLILRLLYAENNKGYLVDWITISSSLLFSMNYAMSFEEFEKQTLYNCIRTTSYCVDGYLDGLNVVCMDYKDLFNQYKNIPGVLFLIDPPYLSTDVSTYSSDYWKLKDYLDVLNVLKEVDYMYFTSNKSNVIELAEWIETNLNALNPFRGAVRKEVISNTTHNTKYTDIMLYRIEKPSNEGFCLLDMAA